MIYLCSLYSLNSKTESEKDIHLRQKRTDYTRERLAMFLCAGVHLISPISHIHEVSVENDLPKDYTFFKEYDHALIDCCSELWVLMMADESGSWINSEGITDEIAYATLTGKKLNISLAKIINKCIINKGITIY